MRRLSETRIEALSLKIAKALAGTAGLRVADKAAAVPPTAARLREAFGADTELDQRVRQRIRSLRREVPEGSREWELLYRQYREELARRR